MYSLNIVHIDETQNSTVSSFQINGKHICFIIEDGFREKKEHGVTRIKANSNILKIVKRQWGGFYERYKLRFGFDFVVEIINDSHTDTIFHIGNTSEDTKGCFLTNTGIIKKTDYVGTQSVKAYIKFMKEMEWVFMNTDQREIYFTRIK